MIKCSLKIVQELCIVNIPKYTRWITEYRNHGELAFSKLQGKALPVNSKMNLNLKEENLEFWEISQENLSFRIENTYLKVLMRLRIEQKWKKSQTYSLSPTKI